MRAAVAENNIDLTKRSAGIADTVVVQSLHNWTVFFEIEAIELIFVITFVLWSDCSDQIYVLIRVESSQILLISIVLVYSCKF